MTASDFVSDSTMPVLESERLRVRPLTPDDVAACHALFQGVGWADPEASHEENRAGFQRWVSWTVLGYEFQEQLQQWPYGERGIELRETGQLIGLVGLVPCLGEFGELESFGGKPNSLTSTEMGLFWMLAPSSRGHGYATEAAAALCAFAFSRLRIERLVAATQHDNKPSIAVMRRLGMHIDTTEHTAREKLQVVGTLNNPAR